MPNFIQSVLNGESNLDDIDDWIEHWHQDQEHVDGYSMSLHEYLGMDQNDYNLYLRHPDVLPIILKYSKKDELK